MKDQTSRIVVKKWAWDCAFNAVRHVTQKQPSLYSSLAKSRIYCNSSGVSSICWQSQERIEFTLQTKRVWQRGQLSDACLFISALTTDNQYCNTASSRTVPFARNSNRIFVRLGTKHADFWNDGQFVPARSSRFRPASFVNVQWVSFSEQRVYSHCLQTLYIRFLY